MHPSSTFPFLSSFFRFATLWETCKTVPRDRRSFKASGHFETLPRVYRNVLRCERRRTRGLSGARMRIRVNANLLRFETLYPHDLSLFLSFRTPGKVFQAYLQTSRMRKNRFPRASPLTIDTSHFALCDLLINAKSSACQKSH